MDNSTQTFGHRPKVFGQHGSRAFFEEETVAIAGDWHSDGRWAIAALKELYLNHIHVIYHVGDFGLWLKSDHEEYMTKVERSLKRYDQVLLITPGNHENYPKLNALPLSEDGLQWVSEHIAVIPRGFRWTVGEKTFLSLGGAPSINYQRLTLNVNWWEEEVITQNDADRAVIGGHVDVMIAHDAPDGIVRVAENIEEQGERWPLIAVRYAEENRSLITKVIEIVTPQLFFHGHHHIAYMEDAVFSGKPSKAVGLHKERNGKNVAILDIKTMLPEWFVIGSY